jgi:hypothetical protein
MSYTIIDNEKYVKTKDDYYIHIVKSGDNNVFSAYTNKRLSDWYIWNVIKKEDLSYYKGYMLNAMEKGDPQYKSLDYRDTEKLIKRIENRINNALKIDENFEDINTENVFDFINKIKNLLENNGVSLTDQDGNYCGINTTNHSKDMSNAEYLLKYHLQVFDKKNEGYKVFYDLENNLLNTDKIKSTYDENILNNIIKIDKNLKENYAFKFLEKKFDITDDVNPDYFIYLFNKNNKLNETFYENVKIGLYRYDKVIDNFPELIKNAYNYPNTDDKIKEIIENDVLNKMKRQLGSPLINENGFVKNENKNNFILNKNGEKISVKEFVNVLLDTKISLKQDSIKELQSNLDKNITNQFDKVIEYHQYKELNIIVNDFIKNFESKKDLLTENQKENIRNYVNENFDKLYSAMRYWYGYQYKKNQKAIAEFINFLFDNNDIFKINNKNLEKALKFLKNEDKNILNKYVNFIVEKKEKTEEDYKNLVDVQLFNCLYPDKNKKLYNEIEKVLPDSLKLENYLSKDEIKKFDNMQLYYIKSGLLNNIDIYHYADPEVNADEMKKSYRKLISEKENKQNRQKQNEKMKVFQS